VSRHRHHSLVVVLGQRIDEVFAKLLDLAPDPEDQLVEVKVLG
jgi:hypothetical protein